jgi:hypothetical protein
MEEKKNKKKREMSKIIIAANTREDTFFGLLLGRWAHSFFKMKYRKKWNEKRKKKIHHRLAVKDSLDLAVNVDRGTSHHGCRHANHLGRADRRERHVCLRLPQLAHGPANVVHDLLEPFGEVQFMLGVSAVQHHPREAKVAENHGAVCAQQAIFALQVTFYREEG